MIQLVGPGGAGKTATGAALAERLGARFVDLDAEFVARHGDISAYLNTHGYEAYAEQNVDLYLDLAGAPVRADIVALSSGFMTYRDGIHPDYLALRQRVASSRSTFVLLPSTDVETCVNEIVRRQLRRPFARSAEREEQVIRERFSMYFGLLARKVETMRPIEAVVAELVAALAAQRAAAPEGIGPRSRAPLARGAIVDARVPQVSGSTLGRQEQMVNALAILGSARDESHTIALLDAVLSGRLVTQLDLRELDIDHYEYGRPMDRDDFAKVAEAMVAHQLIIFATPVYWYAMSGRMKILFDRFTDLVTIRKDMGGQLTGRRVALLACGSEPRLPDGFEVPFSETSAYLGMDYGGAFYAQTSKQGLLPSAAADAALFGDKLFALADERLQG